MGSFATGRGGAGNIHSNPTELTDGLRPTVSTNSVKKVTSAGSDDKRIYYSTGRGGAGNIKSSSEIPSPKLIPQGSNTPQLTSNIITTGRGGFGNMVKNDNPELIRKLQDVDGAAPGEELTSVTSNRSFTVGRGGLGNVVSKTRSHGSAHLTEEVPNLYAVTSNGESRESRLKKQNQKNFVGKLKNLFH
ncbi:uncharacterized protein KQ657_003384 [Scheffersomyces spartinae]|uniref:Uncharacterized protein n=1 Tax=Scheffersomyces spartinae TaxID=45513 RepID=A0A9P8AK80_9ASCO|nr:uncharacterized protein KQ657_003384 [Scheffersomyces spartinae]KAG7195617.1 hypothetical protein KQ657_003384 [Scheffersomyces spartinae]